MMDTFYILLTCAMAVFCIKGPRWGIAALAFLLPVSRRLPSPPIPLLNAQNLIVIVGLVLLLSRRREPGQGAPVRFVLPLLGFLLFATLAFANTELFYEPTRFLTRWDPYSIMIGYKSLLTCLLIYAVGCMVARTREDVDIVFKGLVLGVAFESLFICLEVVRAGPMRANGHLFEGNNAGAYLAGAVATALGAFLMLGWKDWFGRFSLGSALASAFGLVFTLSRGNWMAGIASCSSLALVRDRRVLILIVLLLVTYQMWLPRSAMDRIDESFTSADDEPWRMRTSEGTDEAEELAGLQSTLAGGVSGDSEARLDGSSQIRLYVWNAAIRMIEDRPLGVGFGLFPWYLSYYSDIVKFRAAHNSYLLIACEMGIPALIIFLLFLGSILFECWMAYLKAADPMLRGVGLAALGAGIAMSISALFYNHFFLIEVNGQQWLLLGLATQVRRLVPVAQTAVPAAGPAEAEKVPLYRMVT